MEIKRVQEPSQEKIEEAAKLLRLHGPKVARYLSATFLIWLFGNFVFIPLAASLNIQTKIFVSLIFLIAFAIPVIRVLPVLKKLIDSFSVLPSKKLMRRGFTLEKSQNVLRHLVYVITGVIFYLLFSPFLVIFHPSVSKIALILLLIWVAVLLMRAVSILFPK